MSDMSVLPDVAVGAEWRCVDLHLRTPAVHSFKLSAGDNLQTETGRDKIINEYVQALAAAAIEIGVITDYQGVHERWFVPIRDAAASSGIVILPGVEVSIAEGKGLHLLVICGPDKIAEEINSVVRHLDRDGRTLLVERQQHDELVPTSTLEDAVRALQRRLGCVIVAAHAADTKGIFKAIKTDRIARMISDGLLDGLDKCPSAKAKLTSSAALGAKDVRDVACTLSSDPKSIREVGAKSLHGQQRCTWIKLSKHDADALKLALHDPQTRVLTRSPQPPQHPRIRSIEVDGGFLAGLSVRFNDDLTTLIGGRGAGKSAVLETLRYALDVPPYTDHSERLELVRHAVGSGGRIRLVLDRPGRQTQQYEVTRVFGQRPRVLDITAGKPLDIAPMDVFGAGTSPVILLQREIQAVSRDEGFRRRLLDEIIGEDAQKADREVRRTLDAVRRNARALEDVERKLAAREQHEERLTRLRKEIDYFDQQGVSAKLERHSKVQADEARLQGAAGHVKQSLEAVQDTTQVVRDELATTSAELRSAQSEHSSMFLALAEEVDAVAASAASAAERMAAELASVGEKVNALRQSWPQLVGGLVDDLRKVQEELQATAVNPQTYLDAVGERTALEPIVAGLARQENERKALLTARLELQKQLQDNRRSAFALRRHAVETVNEQLADKLRMTVEYLGDTVDFRQRLGALLQGSRMSKDALDAIPAHPGVDGVELARLVEQGVDAVTDAIPMTSANAQRLVRWLTDDPARLRQVELLGPDDAVSIALIVDGIPRDLATLSGGQKATALLLLLFAQGGRPLVLDQPEDDLDNRFIYDDVVALLRAEKGVVDPGRRRQIIAATHNANIPVNGDAELVLSLADVNARCEVRTRASIDDSAVREEIRMVLEGGEEAFRRRAEKYGGLDDAR
jgi:chromosome segregation protein